MAMKKWWLIHGWCIIFWVGIWWLIDVYLNWFDVYLVVTLFNWCFFDNWSFWCMMARCSMGNRWWLTVVSMVPRWWRWFLLMRHLVLQIGWLVAMIEKGLMLLCWLADGVCWWLVVDTRICWLKWNQLSWLVDKLNDGLSWSVAFDGKLHFMITLILTRSHQLWLVAVLAMFIVYQLEITGLVVAMTTATLRWLNHQYMQVDVKGM